MIYTNERHDDDGKVKRSGELPLRPRFVGSALQDDRLDQFVVGIANVVASQQVIPHLYYDRKDQMNLGQVHSIMAELYK